MIITHAQPVCSASTTLGLCSLSLPAVPIASSGCSCLRCFLRSCSCFLFQSLLPWPAVRLPRKRTVGRSRRRPSPPLQTTSTLRPTLAILILCFFPAPRRNRHYKIEPYTLSQSTGSCPSAATTPPSQTPARLDERQTVSELLLLAPSTLPPTIALCHLLSPGNTPRPSFLPARLIHYCHFPGKHQHHWPIRPPISIHCNICHALLHPLLLHFHSALAAVTSEAHYHDTTPLVLHTPGSSTKC